VAEAYISKQAQVTGPIGTMTDLYTVPAATRTLVSTFIVANIGPQTTVRFTHALLGAADADTQRILGDTVIPANTTVGFTLGLTLNATDKIRCSCATVTSGKVNFFLYGVEKT